MEWCFQPITADADPVLTIDPPPVLSIDMMPCFMPKKTPQVYRMDKVPAFRGLLVQRLHAPAKAGIIHQNVEPPELLLGGCNHALNVILFGHIAMDRDRSIANGRSYTILLSADVGADDFCPLLRKQFGHGLTHTRTCACNYCNFACKTHFTALQKISAVSVRHHDRRQTCKSGLRWRCHLRDIAANHHTASATIRPRQQAAWLLRSNLECHNKDD
jgi:hypothetical protein